VRKVYLFADPVTYCPQIRCILYIHAAFEVHISAVPIADFAFTNYPTAADLKEHMDEA